VSDEEVRRAERRAAIDPAYNLRALRVKQRHKKNGGALWREMSDLEVLAVQALDAAKLPGGTSAKSIRNSLASQLDDRRITDSQAAAMWLMLWTYRRVVLQGLTNNRRFAPNVGQMFQSLLESAPETAHAIRLAGFHSLAQGGATRKAFEKTCGRLGAPTVAEELPW